VEHEANSSEAVRCVVCHTVYEQLPASPQEEEKAACPGCGGLTWIAARIPVEETAAPVVT
jgi:rRNA maturation endonuclease Nob1